MSGLSHGSGSTSRTRRLRRHIVQRGWPRGTVEWRGGAGNAERCPDLPGKLPVPWINGPGAKARGDFHSFRAGAQDSAAARNCIVCGLRIEGDIFLAAQSGDRATSGHGGHARCILLTVTRCPHMVEVAARGADQTVAWRYSGPGVGVLLPDEGEDGWGDHDPVDSTAVPLTIADLKAAVVSQGDAS